MLPKEVQEVIDQDETSVFDEYYEDEEEYWNYSTSCIDDEYWEES